MVARVGARGRARLRLGQRWTFGRLIRWGVGLGLAGVTGLLGFAAWVEAQTAPLIYAPDAPGLPSHHVALVFGAGLDAQGGPSAVLYDRVATAAQLYHAGK